MKNKMRCLTALLLALVCLLCACSEQPPAAEAEPTPEPESAPQSVDTSSYTGKNKVTTEFFGTVCSVVVWDDFSNPAAEQRFASVWKEIKTLLAEIESAVSVSIEGSDIDRFNKLACGERMDISHHTAQILSAAKRAYEDTDGLYDPTVFPLVDLWGFSPRFSSTAGVSAQEYLTEFPPDAESVAALAALADFSGVVLSVTDDSWQLEKHIPAVTLNGATVQAQLDLGGIAKGYAAELVTALLAQRGYEYAYFTCGGSSIGFLKGRDGEDELFNLGMKKPRGDLSGDINYITVSLSRCSISTSGDYDHCRMVGDCCYSHMIDPRTGWPANTSPQQGEWQRGIATATVIGPDTAYADCLSTALCVMGPQAAIEFINTRMPDYLVSLVFFDSRMDTWEIVTNLPEGSYTIDDPAYLPANTIDEQGNIVYTGQIFADLLG